MTVTRDDFEMWLMNMDERLAQLKKLLPKGVLKKLDYSVESLDSLETWLMSEYGTPKQILDPNATVVLDCLTTYVGETMRKQVGGKWNINLKDPDDVFYQMPVIERKNDWTESPGSLITTSLDRRTGTYMSEVISAYMS